MSWLRQIRRGSPEEAAALPIRQPTIPLERAAPGVAALFSGVSEDGTHAVLDMGAGAEKSFALYSRFARRIRFADLLGGPPPKGESWSAALKGLPPPSDRLYDIVLAWNLFDRLSPAGRSVLVQRLVDLTSVGARLYVLVDGSGEATPRPLAFSLLSTDRVSQEAVGPPHPAYPQLLPAAVERLLKPFDVVQAFTLRGGWREYLAIRR